MTTITAVLRQNLQAHPEREVFCFLARDGGRTRWTWQDLDRHAAAVAAQLRERVGPGEPVALLHDDPERFVAGFVGCIYAGVPAVPLASRGLAQLDLLKTSGVRLLLTGDQYAGALEAIPGVAALSLDAVEPGQFRGQTDPDPDDPVVIQFTSGSTGHPKGVVVTHANALANQEMIRGAFGHTADSRIVSWLPLFHDMGLMGALMQPMTLGAFAALMPPGDFIEDPARWLRAVSEFGATTSGGPDFGYLHCCNRVTPEQLDGVDLGGWRVAFDGAEPVRPATLRRFARSFAAWGFREQSFFPCYGLAEATVYVAGGHVGSLDGVTVDGQEVTVVGELADGLQLSIRDADGQPADDVGEIWVTGPSVTSSAWVAGDRVARPGPLRTGDLGTLRNGKLVVLGRIDDLIVLRGGNLHPHDLEDDAVRAHPGLRPGATAAFTLPKDDEGGVELALLAEVRREVEPARHAEIVAAITRALGERHGVAARVHLVPPGTVPRTTSGKVRRRACRELLDVGRPGAARRAGAGRRRPACGGRRVRRVQTGRRRPGTFADPARRGLGRRGPAARPTVAAVPHRPRPGRPAGRRLVAGISLVCKRIHMLADRRGDHLRGRADSRTARHPHLGGAASRVDGPPPGPPVPGARRGVRRRPGRGGTRVAASASRAGTHIHLGRRPAAGGQHRGRVFPARRSQRPRPRGSRTRPVRSRDPSLRRRRRAQL